MYAGPSSKVMQNLYDPHINQSYRIKDHKLKLIKNKAQYKHLSECNKVPTLLTLLRILFLGRIGSISYVLPIRQNIDILNRDIRVDGAKFWIIFKQLKLLRKAGHLQLIQNSALSVTRWHQCDIRMTWNKTPLWILVTFIAMFKPKEIVSSTGNDKKSIWMWIAIVFSLAMLCIWIYLQLQIQAAVGY